MVLCVHDPLAQSVYDIVHGLWTGHFWITFLLLSFFKVIIRVHFTRKILLQSFYFLRHNLTLNVSLFNLLAISEWKLFLQKQMSVHVYYYVVYKHILRYKAHFISLSRFQHQIKWWNHLKLDLEMSPPHLLNSEHLLELITYCRLETPGQAASSSSGEASCCQASTRPI